MTTVPVDEYSATWKVVLGHVQDGIERALDVVAQHGADEAETEFNRGRISAFREFEALGKPRPEILVTPVEPYV